MTKRGSLYLQDGLVVAIEPGAQKGCRIVVETDEPINTRMSGYAAGYEERHAAQPLRTRTIYLTAEEWAALEADAGGQDMLLAHRVVIADLGGVEVLGRTAASFAAKAAV